MGLVIGVGFLMADPIKNVSAKASDANFAIIDYSVNDLGKPKNVRGLIFKEQEAGYLAGALAGMAEEENPQGAQRCEGRLGDRRSRNPARRQVHRGIPGRREGVLQGLQGARRLLAGLHRPVQVSGPRQREISKGSDIVFEVAGGCGLGALEAAKAKGVWGIGVDADQAYLGSHILTSAVKKVDVAVFDTIKSVSDGSFEGGADGVRPQGGRRRSR